jgi:hypothetical protein
VLKQISEAVGLLAAVVGGVYLLGALVLALRLQTNDLPTLPVVSNLPRELVISYGLTYAVAPWLLAGAIVAAFWLLRQKRPSGLSSQEGVWSPRHVRATMLLALVVIAELGVWITVHELGGTFTGWDAAALVASVSAIAALAFAVWRGLSGSYGNHWTRVTATIVAAALSGLVAIPAFVEIGARVPLAEAQLCVAGPSHLRGLLLGETGDRVYIGEDTDPHRVVSSTKTGELYVGPEATEDILCRDERRLKPTADQLIAAGLAKGGCNQCDGIAYQIRVSGGQPWFAAAIIDAIGKAGFSWRKTFLFRRAEAGWHAVKQIERSDGDCDNLAGQTGVTADILDDDLFLCGPTSAPGAETHDRADRRAGPVEWCRRRCGSVVQASG